MQEKKSNNAFFMIDNDLRYCRDLSPSPGQKLDAGRHSDFPLARIYSCGHSAGLSPDSPAGISHYKSSDSLAILQTAFYSDSVLEIMKNIYICEKKYI
jgi:hypothetical protein